MILLKPGVDISRLHYSIRYILEPIAEIYDTVFKKQLIITSAFGDTHMAGSLHYSNMAIDINPLSQQEFNVFKDLFYKKLRALNVIIENYDLVLEGDHIHIEWDLKTEKNSIFKVLA